MPKHYYPSETDPWSFLWATFTDSDAEKLFGAYHIDSQTHIFECGNKQALMEMVTLLTHNSRRQYNSAELLEVYLNILTIMSICGRPIKKPSTCTATMP